ncbi:MAG: xanthine dehydrogenase family protein molybdopterin-binding subunit [Chloroflexota bacterium]|nr:xanthine dehydrogenase family protein molybdopterin-binding subunit [Chloroflexota bacterium]
MSEEAEAPGERKPSKQLGYVGRPIPRREDDRLTTGRGRFVDDIHLRGMAHAALLRSPYAHARIASIDTAAARAMPGVHAVITGQDARSRTKPMGTLVPTPRQVTHYCLAVDKVRFVGEPVAAVAADSRAIAEDALEHIVVEYEPLPVVADAETAMAPGAEKLYDEMDSNILWHDRLVYGDVDKLFAEAKHVVGERFHIQRFASTPLETYGCIAAYASNTQSMTMWCNDGRPGVAIGVLAGSLSIDESRLRFITPDIGGGFGNKRRAAYLVIAGLLSIAARRPVKWIEDRRENLTALMQSAGGHIDISLAVNEEGELLAVKILDVVDEGNNLVNPTLHTLLKFTNLVNAYRIRAAEFEGYAVLTNTCPSGANRGIGKVLMCFAMERLVDRVARRLRIDPAELRRRNLIQPEQMPYTTPNGAFYDSGDYPATLQKALDRFDYEAARRRQLDLRRPGARSGIGIAFAAEPSTSNSSSYIITSGKQTTSGVGEAAQVRVGLDGTVRVSLGNAGSGQGYETAIAQIAADELGVEMDRVFVAGGFDSFDMPWLHHSGNYSNKFAGTDTGAIVGACRKVRRKIDEIADHAEKSTGQRPSLQQVAAIAYRDLLRLPQGMEPGLEASCYYSHPVANLPDAQRRWRGQLVTTNACHLCEVEVDLDTGATRVLRYLVVHDAGTEINPLIVEGQVHGSTVHGIATALLEEFRYDDRGQPLTASFMDYLKPTAAESPNIETDRLETPSPYTPLGAKGVGEGGAVPSPACIANAVEDALWDLGGRVNELPLSPERVWAQINGAKR